MATLCLADLGLHELLALGAMRCASDRAPERAPLTPIGINASTGIPVIDARPLLALAGLPR